MSDHLIHVTVLRPKVLLYTVKKRFGASYCRNSLRLVRTLKKTWVFDPHPHILYSDVIKMAAIFNHMENYLKNGESEPITLDTCFQRHLVQNITFITMTRQICCTNVKQKNFSLFTLLLLHDSACTKLIV